MFRHATTFGLVHIKTGPRRLIVHTGRYDATTFLYRSQSSMRPTATVVASQTATWRLPPQGFTSAATAAPAPWPQASIWIRNTNRVTAFPISPSSSSSSTVWRAMSSQTKQGNDEPPKGDSGKGGSDGDNDATREIVLTPGEQVVAVTRLSVWAGVFCFACACAYYIGKELIPTKMSPNSVFNGASAVIRDDPQVKRQYGDSLKFYGRDHGGHREGRRNFIEHTEYTNDEDGSKRTRVRFNMEGQFASAFCFAEVSKDMPSGEFVYVLVQDRQTGRVITVVDNRAALTAQRLAGGNKETSDAMKQLLGSSGPRKE